MSKPEYTVLNSNIAGRTALENLNERYRPNEEYRMRLRSYRFDNADKIKEYNKQYYQHHKPQKGIFDIPGIIQLNSITKTDEQYIIDYDTINSNNNIESFSRIENEKNDT